HGLESIKPRVRCRSVRCTGPSGVTHRTGGASARAICRALESGDGDRPAGGARCLLRSPAAGRSEADEALAGRSLARGDPGAGKAQIPSRPEAPRRTRFIARVEDDSTIEASSQRDAFPHRNDARNARTERIIPVAPSAPST